MEEANSSQGTQYNIQEISREDARQRERLRAEARKKRQQERKAFNAKIFGNLKEGVTKTGDFIVNQGKEVIPQFLSGALEKGAGLAYAAKDGLLAGKEDKPEMGQWGVPNLQPTIIDKGLLDIGAGVVDKLGDGAKYLQSKIPEPKTVTGQIAKELPGEILSTGGAYLTTMPTWPTKILGGALMATDRVADYGNIVEGQREAGRSQDEINRVLPVALSAVDAASGGWVDRKMLSKIDEMGTELADRLPSLREAYDAVTEQLKPLIRTRRRAGSRYSTPRSEQEQALYSNLLAQQSELSSLIGTIQGKRATLKGGAAAPISFGQAAIGSAAGNYLQEGENVTKVEKATKETADKLAGYLDFVNQ